MDVADRAIEDRGDVRILSGEIIDQSHPQSGLDQLMNHGVELISVNPVPPSGRERVIFEPSGLSRGRRSA